MFYLAAYLIILFGVLGLEDLSFGCFVYVLAVFIFWSVLIPFERFVSLCSSFLLSN